MQKGLKIVIFVIVIIDLVVMGTIPHELTHKFDFRNINKTNEEICFLGCGDFAGYYRFEYQENFDFEYQEISKYTEFHAYFVDFLWLFVCLFVLLKLDNFLEKI